MADRFIDDYLLYLLARASDEVSAAFHARLRKYGLQVAEWRVLATLSDGDGMRLGDLAAAALQRQPTMTKIIDRMESAGLVERRPGTDDRRQVRIHITADGRRRVASALKDAKRHEADVLSRYGAADAARLKSLLRSLIAQHTDDAPIDPVTG
jgi:DNA-binding MarR family transcriptional regulator